MRVERIGGVEMAISKQDIENKEVVENTEKVICKINQRGSDLIPKQNGQMLMGVDTFTSALRIYLQKNPRIMDYEIKDILTEAFRAMCDGLIIDGQESAIIPFKGKLAYIPMLKGSLKMIYRTGIVSSVNAYVVYESELDSFEEVMGTNPQIIHRRNKAPHGKIVASYAVAKLKDGGDVFAVVYQTDIDRAMPKKKDGSEYETPWDTHPSEMWKKTAVHRLRKLMPLNMVASEAIQYHESRQEYDDTIDVASSEVEPIHQLGDMPEVTEVNDPTMGVNDMLISLARS